MIICPTAFWISLYWSHEPLTLLMTFTELAAEVQVPIRTVDYWHQTGIGPKSMTLGRYLRMRRSDSSDWLICREN